MITYQLGTKYSRPYYSNTTDVDPNVCPPAYSQARGRAQSSGNSNVSAIMICEVVNCEVQTKRRCATKACGRYLCSAHFPAGGHKSHAQVDFKPAVANMDVAAAIVDAAVMDAAIVDAADEEEESVDDDFEEEESVVAIHKRTVDTCQVVECDGKAAYRCAVLSCQFTAVCQVHYSNQHYSHVGQLHTDITKKQKR